MFKLVSETPFTADTPLCMWHFHSAPNKVRQLSEAIGIPITEYSGIPICLTSGCALLFIISTDKMYISKKGCSCFSALLKPT